MFLESELLLDEGTEFILEFTLPSVPRFIKAKGKVAWVTRPGIVGVDEDIIPGMGIKFVEISDEDRKKVEEFVDRKFKKLESTP